MKYAVIRDEAIVRFYHARRDLDPSEIKREGGKPVLRPVRMVGFERSFDPDVFERHGPRFTVTATEVVEEYWLAFRADARQAMLDKVDARAEKERARVVAVLAGEALELEETLREAKAALALPPADPIEPGDFPFLDADVGNTVNPETDQPVRSVREAAQVVMARRDAWLRRGAGLKKLRLETTAGDPRRRRRSGGVGRAQGGDVAVSAPVRPVRSLRDSTMPSGRTAARRSLCAGRRGHRGGGRWCAVGVPQGRVHYHA